MVRNMKKIVTCRVSHKDCLGSVEAYSKDDVYFLSSYVDFLNEYFANFSIIRTTMDE
jgi:hypothetical protein